MHSKIEYHLSRCYEALIVLRLFFTGNGQSESNSDNSFQSSIAQFASEKLYNQTLLKNSSIKQVSINITWTRVNIMRHEPKIPQQAWKYISSETHSVVSFNSRANTLKLSRFYGV